MNKEKFVCELKKLGIKTTDKQLEQLDTYYNMIINYNMHTNLTRITEEKEVYLKHFYDSLTLVKSVELDNQSLIDIGTGAGFPGIVLKIFFPNLKITLLDSLNKRIIFLNSVIEKLELKDIIAIHDRAEEFAINNRESFDIVTSRAVANLSVLSELCIPLVKLNSFFIPMKADLREELNDSKSAIKTLGAKIEDIIKFNLPEDYAERTLIKIKKITNTPVKYPRKYNEIKKKPL